MQVPPAFAVAPTARLAGNIVAKRSIARAGATRRIGKY